MNGQPELILVRHGEVDSAWKGICYGAMDVSLSEAGRLQSLGFAKSICQLYQPVSIFHSGLTRTQFLAEAIASNCSSAVPIGADERLRERNYGRWQGLTWDAAYASDPENFHGLIEQPDTYCPPDGETTSEMQSRMVSWLNELIRERNLGVVSAPGPVIVLTHSGPIAAVVGHLLHLHAREWKPWTIATLQSIAIRGLGSGSEPICTLLDGNQNLSEAMWKLVNCQ